MNGAGFFNQSNRNVMIYLAEKSNLAKKARIRSKIILEFSFFKIPLSKKCARGRRKRESEKVKLHKSRIASQIQYKCAFYTHTYGKILFYPKFYFIQITS